MLSTVLSTVRSRKSARSCKFLQLSQPPARAPKTQPTQDGPYPLSTPDHAVPAMPPQHGASAHTLRLRGWHRGMRRAPFLLLTLLACNSDPAGVGPVKDPPTPLADVIALRRDLTVFASDSFRGRASGTPDALRAARFIADQLRAANVEPGGDSAYFQRVPTLGPNEFNVIGIVRGSDPALMGTYVALGAHYDHVGIGIPVNGDSIANGADDDGSGSMALLAIARAVAALPQRPRRSLLFVWHDGEERGLIGSAWFTQHPTVPLDSIVAQLNADMIGRNGGPTSLPATGDSATLARKLFIVGPSAAPNGQSALLGTFVDSVNATQTEPFAFDRTWDNPSHPERIYYRSDHYNYAKMGIPIVFFTTGIHEDYHRVTDEPSRIVYDKLARVTRLIRDVAVAAANRPARFR